MRKNSPIFCYNNSKMALEKNNSVKQFSEKLNCCIIFSSQPSIGLIFETFCTYQKKMKSSKCSHVKANYSPNKKIL